MVINMKQTKTTTPTPTEEAATSEKKEKRSNPNARSAAFILLIPAFLSLIASVFMAWQTVGTNLLFVTASRGQLYRQYPVFLILGLILLLVAICLLRANPASALPPKTEKPEKTEKKPTSATKIPDTPVKAVEAPDNTTPVQTEAPTPAAEPTADANETPAEQKPADKRFCTNCGEVLAPDAKFCTKCGTPQTPTVPADDGEAAQ